MNVRMVIGDGFDDAIELGNEDWGELEIPELDEKDGKCFEMVENLIKDGQLEKLKVYQCKVYLRKYGLRLTGNKDVSLERIREHLEVKDGGGEKKYPISSFVLNCKGSVLLLGVPHVLQVGYKADCWPDSEGKLWCSQATTYIYGKQISRHYRNQILDISV
ncbi:putative zinc finger CCCH domain-containing protein 62 [Cocos nucifera]|uniref:Putative zinc finger CCCH domain-containing protein 62 n=1 Tax=Cocos nucifera TaxID=13894 RepID=A0A8K0ISH6_COCNU|nr:putative zinc finger CCCH domain-containing protein 62 [Cocos nucifera]